MAAEIVETHITPHEEGDTVPITEDSTAMSPEDLAADFEGQDTTAPQSAEDDLPDKYRGKSIKEIVSMHQEAERLIGKQGSEVGELRGIVDQYIRAQTQQNTAQQQPEEDEEEVDFFADPQRAVSRAIEQHPAVRQAAQTSQQLKQASSVQQLKAKHPDAQQVLQNPAFLEWVKGSAIRMELFERADRGFDFAAADELLSSFKERHGVAQQTVEAEQQSRKQQVAKASTGGSTSGANNAGSKRIYRRADIINLMKNDPDRYDRLSSEILQAYAEGRVR